MMFFKCMKICGNSQKFVFFKLKSFIWVREHKGCVYGDFGSKFFKKNETNSPNIDFSNIVDKLH